MLARRQSAATARGVAVCGDDHPEEEAVASRVLPTSYGWRFDCPVKAKAKPGGGRSRKTWRYYKDYFAWRDAVRIWWDGELVKGNHVRLFVEFWEINYKADLSNMFKAVEDALIGLAYLDDRTKFICGIGAEYQLDTGRKGFTAHIIRCCGECKDVDQDHPDTTMLARRQRAVLKRDRKKQARMFDLAMARSSPDGESWDMESRIQYLLEDPFDTPGGLGGARRVKQGRRKKEGTVAPSTKTIPKVET
jgi:hypothetical protein